MPATRVALFVVYFGAGLFTMVSSIVLNRRVPEWFEGHDPDRVRTLRMLLGVVTVVVALLMIGVGVTLVRTHLL